MYFQNLRLGQFCVAVFLARVWVDVWLSSEHSEPVAGIFGDCDNFKVRNVIVRFITVFVIDYHAFGDRANECGGDEAGDSSGADFAIKDMCTAVAVFVARWFKDLARPSVRSSCVSAHLAVI